MQILVVGASKMALLSGSGEVLAEAKLPQPPVGPAIVADFNADGLADVLLITQDAMWGFSLSALPSSSSPMVALIILGIITMVSVFVFRAKLVDDGRVTISRSTDY